MRNTTRCILFLAASFLYAACHMESDNKSNGKSGKPLPAVDWERAFRSRATPDEVHTFEQARASFDPVARRGAVQQAFLKLTSNELASLAITEISNGNTARMWGVAAFAVGDQAASTLVQSIVDAAEAKNVAIGDLGRAGVYVQADKFFEVRHNIQSAALSNHVDVTIIGPKL